MGSAPWNVTEEAGRGRKARWEPKRSTGVMSLAVTLKVLGDLGAVPMRGAAEVLAREREKRGVSVSKEMVYLHLRHSLRAGYTEVATVNGEPCYRLTDKGRELIEKTFGS
jgi:DNA-binding PadR family transcriptional regulator